MENYYENYPKLKEEKMKLSSIHRYIENYKRAIIFFNNDLQVRKYSHKLYKFRKYKNYISVIERDSNESVDFFFEHHKIIREDKGQHRTRNGVREHGWDGGEIHIAPTDRLINQLSNSIAENELRIIELEKYQKEIEDYTQKYLEDHPINEINIEEKKAQELLDKFKKEYGSLDAIKKLLGVEIEEEEKVEEHEECGVCYENQTEVKMSCGHKFCKSCITKWKEHADTCPFCRQPC